MQHIDSHTTSCGSLDQFRKSLKELGIQTAFLSWRAEWAPSSETPGMTHGDVVFGSLREITLLGYQGSTGTLVRYEAGATATREELKALLEADGLIVKERCRNIT